MHPTTVNEIKLRAQLLDVITEFSTIETYGKTVFTTCPMCKETGHKKGAKINKAKGLIKCFSCGWGAANPIKYLMEAQNMSYPDALKWLADYYNIIDKNAAKPRKQRPGDSYRDKQLKESGLKIKDVLALVRNENNELIEIETFISGTRDQFGNIISAGDDLVIQYYNLEGKRVQYVKPKSSKLTDFYRIRWQNPALHLDKSGHSMKYQSPYGSGTHLYIPQFIRNTYQKGGNIKTLYLQEGEKKAEKACKHGLASVGLMGINSIGQKNKLPYELQLLVQKCNVQKVVFIFDADWRDLSSKLKDGDNVDNRPKNFYYAARNFRDYFQTFTNMGIYLELYFGGLKKVSDDKGIDDLLANHLKTKEDEFLTDIEAAINEKDGQGKYIELIKVSDIPDLKLKEYWHLDSAQNFANYYKDRLLNLKEFSINKHRWKFDEKKKLQLAQPLLPNEQFYERYEQVDREGEIKKVNYKFHYWYAYTFLRNRGYGRIQMASGDYELCHLKNKIVEIKKAYQIKDFAIDFALNAVDSWEKVDVMDMIYRGARMYFGPDSLSHLDFINPNFTEADKLSQNFYFKKTVWHITETGISTHNFNELDSYIWKDQIIDFEPKQLTKPMFEIKQITREYLQEIGKLKDFENQIGNFELAWSKEAENTHFARFLWNTSDFYWTKHIKHNEAGRIAITDTRTLDERMETSVQFISKMCAIGYKLHSFFDPATAKAVVAMDGKLSEVGKSNGGSGKSIVGDAIGQVVPQVSIGAKNKKLTEDPFIFEEVTEKTNSVFLDDVRVNLDFEFLFPYITGKFLVNGKGQKKFTIPTALTPKIYISTNHALNGEGSSFARRQFLIPFSDFYNDKHTPHDDFHMNFFTEWDFEQRNLFFNFMAECVQTYLRFGLVEAPVERLELRRLRQNIGEDFIYWADEYFMFDLVANKFSNLGNVNFQHPVPRKELFNAFTDTITSKARAYYSPRKFGDSFKLYCKFRGARFNPHKIAPGIENPIGPADKSGGVENFMIGY